ncbi:hypothetical protein [Oleiphilus messinensis]|uniref:hypothetical protein n=1 Tax=Oleiphilus messinensis TaxID=141451 RepID=UPI0012F9C508|nr:hypothetical protein [Oleiphilus messinensis]
MKNLQTINKIIATGWHEAPSLSTISVPFQTPEYHFGATQTYPYRHSSVRLAFQQKQL